MREVSFQSRVGVCTVDKIPVPTIEIQLNSFNNILTNAGIYQLHVLCFDCDNCMLSCLGGCINASKRHKHNAHSINNDIDNNKNN